MLVRDFLGILFVLQDKTYLSTFFRNSEWSERDCQQVVDKWFE